MHRLRPRAATGSRCSRALIASNWAQTAERGGSVTPAGGLRPPDGRLAQRGDRTQGRSRRCDTPLFATRLLDSLKVLELIAFTEQAIGRAIPDSHIRMDNFQTVARIATVFLPLDDDAAA